MARYKLMIGLVVTLIVIGLLMYLVNRYIPMQAEIKNVLNIVVLIVVIVWLLNVFGVFSYLGAPPIPRLH